MSSTLWRTTALFGLAACARVIAARPAAAPRLHRVSIAQFRFNPPSLSLALGDTVEWINDDILPHTTRADSGAWVSAELEPRGAHRFVVRDTGTFTYHCAAHPVMRAVLVVTPKR